MAVHRKFVESHQVEGMIVPKDITGAAQTSDILSLKESAGIAIVITQGAWAGGTPAVTLTQCQDVSATGAKALGFTEAYRKTGLSNTLWTRFDVTSNTFNLTTTANTVTLIEIGPEQLDRDNGFDCIRLDIASPGANADLLSAAGYLYNIRNAGDPAVIIPPATTN